MMLFEVIEDLPVAEETGDANQQFAIERQHLAGVAFHQSDIVTQVIDLIDCHPSLDAPDHRAGFIERKIHPGPFAQQGKNACHAVFI